MLQNYRGECGKNLKTVLKTVNWVAEKKICLWQLVGENRGDVWRELYNWIA
jgi:hypothetical protein